MPSIPYVTFLKSDSSVEPFLPGCHPRVHSGKSELELVATRFGILGLLHGHRSGRFTWAKQHSEYDAEYCRENMLVSCVDWDVRIQQGDVALSRDA